MTSGSVSPVAGWRYAPRIPLGDVVAPPYDVVDERERDQLAAASPFNIVHVDIPRGFEPYREAAARLESWHRSAVLTADERCVYGYRFESDEVVHVGVIAGRSLHSAHAATLLPHERTTERAIEDRRKLLDATETDLSPIWLLADTDVARLVGEPHEPRIVTFDAVHHTLWQIVGAQADAIAAALSTVTHVVADGHHRLQVAQAHAHERHAGQAATALALFTGMSATISQVRPIYRVIQGLSDAQAQALLRTLLAKPTAAVVEAPTRSFVARWKGAWYRCANTSAAPDTVAIAAAVAPFSAARVSYEHEWATAVASDAMVIAPRPPTVRQLLDTIRQGEVLPPKSTFFFPKPLTGLVLSPHRSW